MTNIIKRFEKLPCDTYIYDDSNGEGAKFLECVIEGTPYRLNVNWVPEKDLDWLAQVYSHNLCELYTNTRKNQLKELNEKVDGILKFLGRKQ